MSGCYFVLQYGRRVAMAKRTNQVTWGLAAILAVAVLGGVSRLAAQGRQRGAFTLHRQPLSEWRCWWVGQRPLVVKACGPRGSRGTLVGQRYSLGFLEVRVPRRGPEVVLYDTSLKASMRSDTRR